MMTPAAKSQKLPVSCFIIALNEADRIGRAIGSVADWVEEVVVIDSGSTDDTVAVAERLGARVVYNAWPGFGQQKRFGEDQCRSDWLLNIDADEVVTPLLKIAILNLFQDGEPKLSIYGMAVNIVYPGWHQPRRWARDHYCLRLYDRRKTRFKDSTLYDSVARNGLTYGDLPGGLDHHSVRSLDDLIAKSDARARYNAAHSKAKSDLELKIRLVTEFPVNFLKYYIVRTHFSGGLMGFQFALITAFYRWVRIVRMKQAQDAGRR